jgi:hypothetical protein
MRYILAVLLLSGCGTKELEPAKPKADYPELRDQVERVEPLLAWTCDGMIPARSHGFPCIKEGDGVSMLGRIIADTGDRSKLPAVRSSIGPDGRLWRNPERVGNDGPNSASRDAFIGLLETRDKESIKRVMAYIKANGRLCPGDDRCDVTPSVRFLAEETLGVAHTKAEIAFDIETLWLEAETAPPTYRAYLVGRKLLAHIRLGNLNSGYARVAKRLNERFPRNPFLAYVNAVANKKSFDPIAKDLTACLAQWEGNGDAWHGNEMAGCQKRSYGHHLIGLGYSILGK